ncbi:MAG: DEAD/DEAH box helicase [Deltaproteobacteria bacterium]|nr:DEAD/DEAH box helicase [Deltaproteobacteria bacterium]
MQTRNLAVAVTSLDDSDAAFEEDQCSAGAFEAVATPLRDALRDRGFSALTAVQQAVLEATIDGRDLQISSQTGSGKTVALGFVMAPQLLELDARAPKARPLPAGPVALVIVPTRELAAQVKTELEWLYAGVPAVVVECVTGGTSVGQERRRLGARPPVVVGTPGRLLDHIRSGALDCSLVSQLVLDEADRMLDMGFREELAAILEATPAERRTHLVSATFPPEIRALARQYQVEPLQVQGTRLGVANVDIEHVGHLLRQDDRYAALVNILLLAEGERTLVFVNTRVEATQLADQLSGDGFTALPLSGELEQAQRTRTLAAFRNGAASVLVATDVAARGLDIPEVGTVIHTAPPIDSETYTHRSGRTGRAGLKGRSVLLAPAHRQRKVEFLLARAKVKIQWREVPTAASVAKALAKRERRRLEKALDGAPELTETQLEYARALLEKRDAAQLVANLIEQCRAPHKAAPREVKAASAELASRPEARSEPRHGQDAQRPRVRQLREDDRYQRRDDGYRRPEREDDSRRGGAVHFEINWGYRDGASPQRLLAVICRRGDISSRMIGAIDVDTHVATFEVAGEAAREFDARVRRPDSRDPDLCIRRVRAYEGPAGPRRIYTRSSTR